MLHVSVPDGCTQNLLMQEVLFLMEMNRSISAWREAEFFYF